MGYFALSLGKTWQEKLSDLEANIQLLKKSPNCNYLFDFMEICLEQAKAEYYREQHEKLRSEYERK